MTKIMPKITKDMLADNHDGVSRIRINVDFKNGRFFDKTFKITNDKSLGSMVGYIQAVTDCGGEVRLSD